MGFLIQSTQTLRFGATNADTAPIARHAACLPHTRRNDKRIVATTFYARARDALSGDATICAELSGRAQKESTMQTNKLAFKTQLRVGITEVCLPNTPACRIVDYWYYTHETIPHPEYGALPGEACWAAAQALNAGLSRQDHNYICIKNK